MADWLSSSFSPPWLGLALCVAAVLMGAGALWWVRVPGPVTRDERTRSTARLAGLAALLGPLVMIAAVCFLAFPIRRPTVVGLVTRSRPPDGSFAKGYERGRFDPALHKASPRGGFLGLSYLDAGVLVNEVCRSLPPDFDSRRWTARDAGVVRKLRDEIQKVLDVGSIERARVARQHDFLDRDGESCRNLPRGLVESIEISLLRALPELINVVEIRVVGTERKTVMGDVWTGVREYLKSAQGHRHGLPPMEVIPIGRVQEPDVPRIETLLGPLVVEDSGRRSVHCLVSLPAGQPVDGFVHFVLRSERDPDREVLLPATPGSARLVRFEVRVEGELAGLRIAIRGSEAWHPVEMPGDDPGENVLVAGLFAPAEQQARWARTSAHLGSCAGETVVARWCSWMERFGLPVSSSRLQWRVRPCNQKASSEVDVVVDTCAETGTQAGPVWVYPARTSLRHAASPLEVDPEAWFRGRVTRHGLPGPYSLDAMPLARGHFWTLAERAGETCGSTLAQKVAADFRQGVLGHLGPSGIFPILSHQRIGERQTQTLAGFSFREQGMLLGANGRPVAGEPFEMGRLLAGWTQLVAAVYHAHRDDLGCDPAQRVEDDPTHPFPVLDAGEIHRYRGRGILAAVALFAMGLALYGGVVVRGISRAPGP